MSYINLHTLLAYKEVGRPVSDEELKNAFDRMRHINLVTMLVYIKAVRLISDEELREIFHRLVACWNIPEDYGRYDAKDDVDDGYEYDALAEAEEDAMEMEWNEEQVLRALPSDIRRRILGNDTSKK